MKQKNVLALQKSSTPTGLIWYNNMADFSLFRYTNMADVTSRENAKNLKLCRNIDLFLKNTVFLNNDKFIADSNKKVKLHKIYYLHYLQKKILFVCSKVKLSTHYIILFNYGHLQGVL